MSFYEDIVIPLGDPLNLGPNFGSQRTVNGVDTEAFLLPLVTDPAIEGKWPGDNTWDDVSGLLNHITNYGGTFDSNIKKLGSHSAAFNGIDQYAVSPVLGTNIENYSIAGWMYCLSSYSARWGNIIDFQGGGSPPANTGAFTVVFDGNDSKIKVYTGFIGTSGGTVMVSSAVVTTPGWHFVAFSAKRNGDYDQTITLYVDGVVYTAITGRVILNTVSFSLGRFLRPPGTYYVSQFDMLICLTRSMNITDMDYLWNGGYGTQLDPNGGSASYPTNSPAIPAVIKIFPMPVELLWSTFSAWEQLNPYNSGSIEYQITRDGGTPMGWLTQAQIRARSNEIANSSVIVQPHYNSNGGQRTNGALEAKMRVRYPLSNSAYKYDKMAIYGSRRIGA